LSEARALDSRRESEVVRAARLGRAGRVCDQLAVGPAGELPAALVAHDVVAATQQAEVAEIGRAASLPGDQVVGVAPWVRAVTAREGAAGGAVDQGATQRAGDDARATAEVQDFGAAAHDDVADAAVTGEALQ